MRPFLLAAALLAGILAMPGTAHATWVGDHCSQDRNGVDTLKRSEAKAYGSVARAEGYEYGGGCWNDNDRDDTPNQPNSGGEGPDCSGLVFKSWGLKPNWGQSGINWYNKFDNVHGPYASGAFHDAPSGAPFYNLPDKYRATTLYMDAFAKDGHVALIWNDAGASGGGDYILEARGDSDGTDVWVEDYRHDGAYTAVRRKGWTPDCFPQCMSPAARDLVPLP